MNYSYPINEAWTTKEIIDVVNYYAMIEKTYEKGVLKQDLIVAYNRYKEIVPSKSEEKQLDKQFEKQTGYVPYHVIKKAKDLDLKNLIKM
ncbi:hypothetical protein JCM21714_753 [Gracilibacillus boraciitolerans JCM 21714]|uniref:Uncharacterized protein n=1 Tax=Gracilibacillus boraciitolerans JCM 21714 TaxID=1298598 RepID=W4VF42_9BACI|nr:UPF0223 family protein [Gracilibacillus boraciitolerans]GAE91796.1 hypothetical protein JCM21714_753 [Gracilibacillus boraciitolerans JCM 21714]